MKNQYFSLLAMVILLLTSCHKDAVEPLLSCEEFITTDSGHPLASDYQAVLDKYVAKSVPGVVALVYSPENGLWIGASGVSVIESAIPMETCNLFYSASLAKTYHVVAALALAEEGLLQLDKPIDFYLTKDQAEKIPNVSTATVMQLMNHTAGIPDFIEEINHVTDYYHDLTRTFTTDEYLDYVRGKKPLFEPGTNVSYTNTHTVLLALIMDQVYGDHAKAITDKIIQPLGLEHTFYRNESAYPKPKGLVNTYLDNYGNGQLQNSTAWESNFSQMSIGHDGMIIHPYDNFLFLKALVEGNIIRSSLVDSMVSERATYNEGRSVFSEGLGVEITTFEGEITQRIGHNGGSLGGANEMRYYPDKGVYICTSANFGGFVDSPIGDDFYPSPRLGTNDNLYEELEKIVFGL